MNNKQILKKVIERAIKNGWRQKQNLWKEGLAINIITNKCSIINYYSIIFSHDFANAFWGEGIICKKCGGEVKRSANTNWYCIQCGEFTPTIKYFLYCLQQMVREKEPLKYLERFL